MKGRVLGQMLEQPDNNNTWDNLQFTKRYSTDLCYMYGLLTKCEVKMAGYWPSSFFYVFMDQDEVEVHKVAKKKNEANIQLS